MWTVGVDPTYSSFLEGITFRFSAYESRREWTESHISRLTAGQDLILSSGNDLVLVGGTVVSAAQNASLTAANDILVSTKRQTFRDCRASAQSPNGNFNLRSDSASGVGRWTIDVPATTIGRKGSPFELKFE